MTPTSKLMPRAASFVFLASLLALGACGGGVVRPSHAFKANAHLDEGRPFDAIEEYRQALAEDPADYRMTYNLGLAWHDAWRLLNQQNQGAEADRAFEEAKAQYLRVHEVLDPGNARALCSLAVLEDESGNTQGARERLGAFVAGAGAEDFLPNYTLATMELRGGNRSRASELLRASLNANPQHVPSAVALLEVLREEGGSFEEMRAVLDDVNEGNDFDFTLKKERAMIDLAQARQSRAAVDWQRARASLIAAQALNEGDWEVAFGLAEAYESRGEVRRAVYELWQAEAALEDDPTDKGEAGRRRLMSEIQTRLQRLYGRLQTEDRGAAKR